MNINTSFTSVRDNKKWFLENLDLLMRKYKGKYVLIVNQEIKNSHHDDYTLIQEGKALYGSGNFCVTLCEEQIELIIAPIISTRYA